MKFVLIIIISLFITNIETKLRRRKWCHINELIRCTDSLRVFTAIVNGTGIPTNSRELDAFCFYGQTIFPDCIRKWTNKCGLEHHQQLIEVMYIDSLIESVRSSCSGSKRENFLKYSPCLHSKIKLSTEYRETCISEIQFGFEYIQSRWRNASMDKKYGSVCCVYNRWQSCIRGFLTRKCGETSEQSIVDLIQAGSAHLIDQLCPLHIFNADSELCAELLPPMNEIPKGVKSDSFLSYIFSYLCPNVGFGIIPERDSLTKIV